MAVQAAREVREAQAAASEHMDELAARIEQRQRWLDNETLAVQRKIEDAQRPVVAERQARAQARAAVLTKVEELRWGGLKGRCSASQLAEHSCYLPQHVRTNSRYRTASWNFLKIVHVFCCSKLPSQRGQ